MKKTNRLWRRLIVLAIATVIMAAFGTSVGLAQSDAPPMLDMADPAVAIDTTWLMITAFIVFFMQAGFAMLETGIVRQTGSVNALLENFLDAAVTAICWWLVGFGIAFGADNGSGLFGTTLFAPGMDQLNAPFAPLNVTVLTFFFFQFAFAATAATIATGAMAERTDFIGDMIYTVVIAVLIYPVIVHWIWGGGWLFNLGFHDFAGSTVVHTVGGTVALIGAALLGPRPGRVWGKPPRPHNLALATLGTMILWFGWYGFNPGSTLGAINYGGLIGLVAVNTTLGAAAGAILSMFVQYFRTGKWDLLTALNGSLAGLVGITAGCAFVSPAAAIIIGAIAGVLVLVAAEIVERVRIDDAVGAFAVHGACGIWGTLAVGLFAEPSLTYITQMAGQGGLLVAGGGVSLLGVQAVGSLATVAWTGITGVVMFGALRLVNRLRVDKKADAIGIDFYEHGASVWPDVLPHVDEVPMSGDPVKAPAVGD